MSLIEGETDVAAIFSNVSALLNQCLDNINWVGFYLLNDNELVLGPFQGNVACYRIPVGTGVCGTAMLQNKSQCVADVHQFPGHIACDSASQSELVVPISVGGVPVGVLDIDSPSTNRFNHHDVSGMELLIGSLGRYLDSVLQNTNVLKSSCSYPNLGK